MQKTLFKSLFALLLITVLSSTAFADVRGYGHHDDDHDEHDDHGNGGGHDDDDDDNDHGDDNHGNGNGGGNHGDSHEHHGSIPPPLVCKDSRNPVFKPAYSQFRKYQVFLTAAGLHQEKDGKLAKGACVRK